VSVHSLWKAHACLPVRISKFIPGWPEPYIYGANTGFFAGKSPNRHLRCIHTVLANPFHTGSLPGAHTLLLSKNAPDHCPRTCMSYLFIQGCTAYANMCVCLYVAVVVVVCVCVCVYVCVLCWLCVLDKGTERVQIRGT
jgi:hypothetical protein